MADAHDSKSCEETHESSSLSPGTLRRALAPLVLAQGKPRARRRTLSERSELKSHIMHWFVYLAKTITGRYYTGITTDPGNRIVAHNTGMGSQMAKQQGPFELVYLSKPFLNKSEARKREIQIKGWTRNKKEKLILGEWV